MHAALAPGLQQAFVGNRFAVRALIGQLTPRERPGWKAPRRVAPRVQARRAVAHALLLQVGEHLVHVRVPVRPWPPAVISRRRMAVATWAHHSQAMRG